MPKENAEILRLPLLPPRTTAFFLRPRSIMGKKKGGSCGAAVGKFRKYLLVSDRDDCRTTDGAQLDVVSWDTLNKIGNAADYDGWILNTYSLKHRTSPKIFTSDEWNILFRGNVFGRVLVNGGSITVVGDFFTTFFTPPNTGGGALPRGIIQSAVNVTAPPGKSSIRPFEAVILVERDTSVVDYRRISRPDDYSQKLIYEYLDKAKTFEYSLRIGKKADAIDEITQLGTTTFGTCLAAVFRSNSGRVFLLPSLGTTLEEEERFVLEKVFGFGAPASLPKWAASILVPGQREIAERKQEKLDRAKQLLGEVKRENENLQELERWKRLLYDDGSGLEDIVKESFESLGGKVDKISPEKADLRMTVGDVTAAIEIKGTKNSQFAKKDLRQLNEWVEEIESDALKEIKGIFVGNADRESDPTTRPIEIFDSNNLSYAVFKKMIVLRSMDLYCLVVLKMTDRLTDLWDELLAGVGTFDASKYWARMPKEYWIQREEAKTVEPAQNQ